MLRDLIILAVVLVVGFFVFQRGRELRAIAQATDAIGDPFDSVPPADTLEVVVAEYSARQTLKNIKAKNRARARRLMWIGSIMMAFAVALTCVRLLT